MSYIPDCRQKFETNNKNMNEKIINPYWYGLLRGDDAEFLRGYDWNTSMSINNFFDNLDIYADKLEKEGISVDFIDTDIVNGADEDYNITMPHIKDDRKCKYYSEYSDEELRKMSKSTRIMLLMKELITFHIENCRDELIVSAIENMDEDEYDKIYIEESSKSD